MIKELEDLNNNRSPTENSIPVSDWLEHFRNLMIKKQNDRISNLDRVINSTLENKQSCSFTPLDYQITHQEISKCVSKLKNGKSPGSDQILNEFIKFGITTIIPAVTKLFNNVYSSGIFPDLWASSMIKPLHKGGPTIDPSNYRGISITSCLGKLFCAVLNNRLINHLETSNILTPLQIAFRKQNRTSDHMFILNTLINKYVKQKVKKGSKNMLFVCFIDFSKAFDTVWREALFYKLLQYNIDGKLFDIVKDMYKKSRVCIKLKKGVTEEFTSNIGVKQGCVISPTLFNLFINDIPDIFSNPECDPVTLQKHSINCLLYADDLLVISKSETGLTTCLKHLEQYCNKWKLKINSKKSKIIIFNKSGHIKKHAFYINNEQLEIVHNQKYLGIIFNSAGSFSNTIHFLHDKANRAIFKLRKSFGPIQPSIKTSLHLFDCMIKPILTYASEIWGVKMCNINNVLNIAENKTNLYYKSAPDKCYIKWLKQTLGVHSKSTNIAVSAELGCFPVLHDAYSNIISYWNRLQTDNIGPILKDAYLCNQNMLEQGQQCWLSDVKLLFCKVGLERVWRGELKYSNSGLKQQIKLKLQDIFEQQWKLDMYNDNRQYGSGNKLRTYRKFKSEIALEPYLFFFRNNNTRKSFSKLRISAHNLAIESGRHHRPSPIPLNDRICSQCNTGDIEDEFHLIISCNKFRKARGEFLTKLTDIFPTLPDYNEETKFIFIMQCQDRDITILFEKFLNTIIKTRGKL